MSIPMANGRLLLCPHAQILIVNGHSIFRSGHPTGLICMKVSERVGNFRLWQSTGIPMVLVSLRLAEWPLATSTGNL